MARKAKFPPKVHTQNGYDRTYWKGRWHYLGPAGSPEADRRYKELIARWAGADLAPPPPVRTRADLTVAELADQYLAEQQRARAGKRELDNIGDAVRVLVRCFGDRPASDFCALDLERLQAVMGSGEWMRVREKWKRVKARQNIGWCKNRVNLMTHRIRAIWRWGEKRKLVPAGSWHHLRTVPQLGPDSPLARDTEPRQPSRLEDVERVASRCPDAVAAMLLLMWHSGARTGEVLILRTMDVDCSGEVWTYRPGSELPYGRHKNSHRRQHRVVLLGPEAQRILKPWLRPDQPGAYVFAPSGNRAERDRYDRHTFSQAVRRACRTAGVKVQPYQSRHAFRLRVTRELGLEAAAAALGHASLRTTERYAAGADLEQARAVAKKCG